MAANEDAIAVAMKVGDLMADRTELAIRSMETRLNERVDSHHKEAMQQIEKIKEAQTVMQVSQARMEVRLEEGERRFSDLEERVTEVEELEKRVTGLEQRELSRENPEPISRKKYIIVGTVGVAGATGLFAILDGLKKIFGH